MNSVANILPTNHQTFRMVEFTSHRTMFLNALHNRNNRVSNFMLRINSTICILNITLNENTVQPKLLPLCAVFYFGTERISCWSNKLSKDLPFWLCHSRAPYFWRLPIGDGNGAVRLV